MALKVGWLQFTRFFLYNKMHFSFCMFGWLTNVNVCVILKCYLIVNNNFKTLEGFILLLSLNIQNVLGLPDLSSREAPYFIACSIILCIKQKVTHGELDRIAS